MKKIIISSLLTALVVLTFASCRDKMLEEQKKQMVKVSCPCCEEEKMTKESCVFDGKLVCETCYAGLVSGRIR